MHRAPATIVPTEPRRPRREEDDAWSSPRTFATRRSTNGRAPRAAVVRVGITDFAQDALGDVVYVDLPEVGSDGRRPTALGEVESTKSVSDVFSPVTGTSSSATPGDERPELVNEQPYGDGWLVVIEPGGPGGGRRACSTRRRIEPSSRTRAEPDQVDRSRVEPRPSLDGRASCRLVEGCPRDRLTVRPRTVTVAAVGGSGSSSTCTSTDRPRGGPDGVLYPLWTSQSRRRALLRGVWCSTPGRAHRRRSRPSRPTMRRTMSSRSLTMSSSPARLCSW